MPKQCLWKSGFLAIVIVTLSAVPSLPSTFVSVDLPTLAASSEAVVRARVIEVTSEWNQERTFIFTHVVLERIQSLKGAAGDEIGRLVVRVPGGTVDDFTAVMEGAPRFVVNEDVVVFLSRWHDGVLMVAGYEQGMARVEADRDGRMTLRGGIADGMALPELASQLRAGSR